MIYQKVEFLICNSVQCALYTFDPLRFVFCICTVIKLQIKIDVIFTHDRRKDNVKKMLLLELFFVQRRKQLSNRRSNAGGGGQSVVS